MYRIYSGIYENHIDCVKFCNEAPRLKNTVIDILKLNGCLSLEYACKSWGVVRGREWKLKNINVAASMYPRLFSVHVLFLDKGVYIQRMKTQCIWLNCSKGNLEHTK